VLEKDDVALNLIDNLKKSETFEDAIIIKILKKG
jgi:hypothetical protein